MLKNVHAGTFFLCDIMRGNIMNVKKIGNREWRTGDKGKKLLSVRIIRINFSIVHWVYIIIFTDLSLL